MSDNKSNNNSNKNSKNDSVDKGDKSIDEGQNPVAVDQGAGDSPAPQEKNSKGEKELVKEKTAAMKKDNTKPAKKKEPANHSSSAKKENAEDQKQVPMSNPTNISQKKSLMPSIALVVSIAAIAGSAYVWQQGQQQQVAVQTELNLVAEQLQQQQQRERIIVQQFDKQALENKQTQQQLNEQINSLHMSLRAQKKRLQSLATTDRDDWLLAEAEYLMKLANQRLLMGKEIEGAAELLEAADDILKDFDDAALHAVRKILADEITALKSAARFDVEGAYLRVGALANQVDQMALFKAPQLKTEVVETPAVVAETWQQNLENSYQQAKQKLSRYIQIKRRDESYKPMLAPEQEAAIKHSLRLMFEQAQLAMLAGKQRLYDESMQKSQQWVNDYFAIDEQQVARFNALIEELKRQTVTVELPDISASSRALKTYIETIHELPKKKPAPSQPATSEPSTLKKESEVVSAHEGGQA